MLMSEFTSMVESKFAISKAVIMKRTPMMQNQAVELLNDISDKLAKGLNELRINEGVILYVEDAEVKHHSSSSESTKWETEFELEMNRCLIKYNLPSDKPQESWNITYSE